MLSKIANSPRMLVLTAICILLLSSCTYSLAEHASLMASVWWAIITATTVGYGDLYPTTPMGRAVAMVLVVSMVLFFIPMVTAGFASKLIVDRNAFTHEEQEHIKQGIDRLLRAVETGQLTATPSPGTDQEHSLR
jgi:voltage-gated potassium channel